MMQAEVVAKVLSLAQKAVKETHRDRLEAYIHAYCRAIPPEVLEQVDPQRLLSFVMDRFAFLEEDFGKTVKVELRDPATTLLADEAPCTVIETRLPDCAFIIRTIKAFLRQHGLATLFVLHPIHGVVHEGGQIVAIDRGRGTRYSQVYMQVSAIPPERREALRQDLERRLELTLLVNRDYPTMAAKLDDARALMETASSTLKAPARVHEAREAVELIDWLKDANFIISGYAWFPNDASNGKHPEKGLGLFASEGEERRVLDEVIGEIAQTRRGREELYSFYRTDYITVVRSVAQLRYFGVAQPGPDGKLLGEHVFVGLLSTKALKQPNRRVPVIGKRIAEVTAKLEESPGSYAYTKIVAILDSLPSEDLFYWTIDEIHQMAVQIRQTESKDQARAFVWRRPGGRRLTIVCAVPRMRFSEALREQVSQEIRHFLGVPRLREYRQETDDESPIRMHFTVGKYRPGVAEGDLEKLGDDARARCSRAGTISLRGLVFKRYKQAAEDDVDLALPRDHDGVGAGHVDAVRRALPRVVQDDAARHRAARHRPHGLARGRAAARRARRARRGRAAPHVAAHRVDEGAAAQRRRARAAPHGAARDEPARRAARRAGPRHLHHRLRDQRPGRQAHRGSGDARSPRDHHPARPHRPAPRRSPARPRPPRRPRLHADRSADHVSQLPPAGVPELRPAIGRRGAAQAPAVRRAVRRVLPDQVLDGAHRDRRGPRREAPAAARREVRRAAAARDGDPGGPDPPLPVRSRRGDAPHELLPPGRADVISIKVDSAQIEPMPRPCPLYEVYVHGPGVEGIHLRGGKVARGGIRHSDRADDFRTEVQGLQRTQTLKNTVIVPVGSKGGFVTRKQLTDRAEAAAEAKRQYQAYMSGMLDITDNYVGTKIVPPPGVVRYDDDDPYLVVAADKGTAHLSDTANGISAQYKFWLDDAFASGGSAGYDHKAMGITSRGGWTNVERHFREMGIDIRKTSIRVAGVGDMSGDVFGNGMLLNDKLRLVAAFNHKHVFIDPTPDMAVSYAERRRMFDTPGTQWSDYKKEAISKGGGVFERAAKEITLSREAKALLGLTADVVSGPDIVRAILALDVDLMWFGGIGTYVKASTESHGEVGDKVNDNVRINATDLHAKVIGEGANLAITQRARTEYLMAGGRGNTDAIDNSAGVDCSDHEVNLKILLSPLTSTGAMSRVERDKLLRELEPDVGLACVQDNYLQSALLSMESLRTRKHGEVFLDLLSYLDKQTLNRAAEHIPPDEELRGWLATGKGLPRNLLAVLVAHTKLDLVDRVLASRIPDLPLFQPFLVSYFPPKLAEKYGDQISKHQLRREIIATVINNAIVNQAGTTLLVQLAKESGLADRRARGALLHVRRAARRPRVARGDPRRRLQDRGGGPVRAADGARGHAPAPAAVVELERADVEARAG